VTYRDELEALSARHTALELEVADKIRERDRAARLLDEAQARQRPPQLDDVRVASPCSAEWSQMTGDDHVRLCGACSKHVYNLSGMTRDEAEALIVAKEGRLCVRYFQRPDGTILLADCTIGRKRKQKQRLVAFGAMALLAGGGVVAYKLSRPECVATPVTQGQSYPVPGNIEMRGEADLRTPPALEVHPDVHPPVVHPGARAGAHPGAHPEDRPLEVRGRLSM
jgi:hypothetical protein